MIEGLKDVWSKLTPEEQVELSQEFIKILQEEIDREFIAEVKRIAAENNDEQSK